MVKCLSSTFSFSTIPVYSSSDIGSMAAPKKPWRRMSMDFREISSRTVFQNGWAKALSFPTNSEHKNRLDKLELMAVLV